MSEEGGFLNRWSRLKAEARKEPEAVALVPDDGAPAGPGEAAAPPETVTFDLSKLPSIDSIDAATDIKAFLAKGVPDSLRAAALRQVWAADPAIRDYVGPYDYAWDFNAPTMHGFGEIAPGTDVAGIVRTIMEGHGPAEDAVAVAAPVAPTAEETLAEASGEERIEGGDETPALPAGDADPTEPETAKNTQEAAIATPRRRHGGATPR